MANQKQTGTDAPELLQISDLSVHFDTDDGTVRALDGVSFSVGRQETLGLVGESGCGKSVTALSIMRILPSPGRIVGGRLLFRRKQSAGSGIDLAVLEPNGQTMRSIRGNEIAMIFQEPMTSLSPVHAIGNQIQEAVRLHQSVDKREARRRAVASLNSVRMPNPERQVDAYPHQLSGGMRQRAMIAMALSCEPDLLIADEPTTALDVTVQAQILYLMKQLQQERRMSILLITHDLGVIARMADRVAVMYLGRIVEQADVRSVFKTPAHPYTRALLKSIPTIGRKGRLDPIAGSVPDPFEVQAGCAFAPRCSQATAQCSSDPPVIELRPGHEVRCWLHASVKKASGTR